MRRSVILLLLLFLMTVVGTPLATAQEARRPTPPEKPAEKPAVEKKPLIPTEDKLSVTQHTVRLADGQVLRYTATAGHYVLRDEDGTPKTAIFFIAYTRDDVTDKSRRPITFAFNGGPGSSSVWLHMGAFGPRRVRMTDEGAALPPPGSYADNPYTLLDVTDLVFIDPTTTGYSRAEPGQEAKQFHAYEADIESVGEFIRLYTTRFQRWTSPKYLAGESYGTTRAAGLVRYLQDRHGMYFNGVILVSSILNFQTARFDVGNDLPYILFLPTYTATAWYHKKLPADLQADLRRALEEAQRFAETDYTLALMKGDDLPEAERRDIAARLARYTGLSEDYIQKSNLRVPIFRFVKELLRDRRLTVGRLDTRFTGMDRDAAGETFEFDPSYAVIQGAFTAALNHYVRSELKYESDLIYEILTNRVRPWRFEPAENRYLNVAESLRAALTQNPHLRVFVASGYYDLATPFFATDYTLRHMSLEPPLRKNIEVHYYEAGHMMYIHRPSLERLKADLRTFFQRSLGE